MLKYHEIQPIRVFYQRCNLTARSYGLDLKRLKKYIIELDVEPSSNISAFLLFHVSCTFATHQNIISYYKMFSSTARNPNTILSIFYFSDTKLSIDSSSSYCKITTCFHTAIATSGIHGAVHPFKFIATSRQNFKISLTSVFFAI